MGQFAEPIKQVILSGLATRMPLVREMVRDTFGVTPICKLEPDEVVALGAAVQAAILKGLERGKLLLDCVSLGVGVEASTGSFVPIVHRQTTIPTAEAGLFRATSPSQ